jgi:hypothetical protein
MSDCITLLVIQSIFNFVLVKFLCIRYRSLNCLYYIILGNICQELFEVFSNFFFDSLSRNFETQLLVSFLTVCIIPNSKSFVKNFFEFSDIFLHFD